MPLFIFIITSVIVILGFVIFKARADKETISIKNKIMNCSLFTISLICLVISLKLFWNMADYVDEYGVSIIPVYGGVFWANMDWLRLGLLLALCIISAFNAFKRTK